MCIHENVAVQAYYLPYLLCTCAVIVLLSFPRHIEDSGGRVWWWVVVALVMGGPVAAACLVNDRIGWRTMTGVCISGSTVLLSLSGLLFKFGRTAIYYY